MRREKSLVYRFYEPHKHTSQALSSRGWRLIGHYLHKPDGSRLLTEALATQVEAILTNETRLVRAEATAKQNP
jgi:hypothetical protein